MVKIEQPHDVFIYFRLSWIKDYIPLPVLILYISLCISVYLSISLYKFIHIYIQYIYIYIYIIYIYIYIYKYINRNITLSPKNNNKTSKTSKYVKYDTFLGYVFDLFSVRNWQMLILFSQELTFLKNFLKNKSMEIKYCQWNN